jgi:hypothetical protein
VDLPLTANGSIVFHRQVLNVAPSRCIARIGIIITSKGQKYVFTHSHIPSFLYVAVQIKDLCLGLFREM